MSGGHAGLELFDPDAPPRPRRALRAPAPEEIRFSAKDGVGLRLRRYRGGPKGPVILAHCIGVSSLMYAVDTLETNLLEFLAERGFDVFLLDFRFSIELPASAEPHSFDEVARLDYPAAVDAVRAAAASDSVQIVAHGVGSSTLTMALLAGLRGVRSAVCSQVSTHVLVPPLTRIKAELRLPSLAAALGLETITTYVDAKHSTRMDRVLDSLLRFHPIEAEERCSSAVCRRITALYGELYEHDRLSDATHGTLHELFGVVSLRALAQLARLTRAGHLVDEGGDDAYLPHAERLAIPIAFLHGAENRCVLPESTRATIELLAARNGAGLYERHEVPGYGHVDCILGATASRDVYPIVARHLEAHAGSPR